MQYQTTTRRGLLKAIGGTAMVGGGIGIASAQQDLETKRFIFRYRPRNSASYQMGGGLHSGCGGEDKYKLIRGGIYLPEGNANYNNSISNSDIDGTEQDSARTAVSKGFDNWSSPAPNFSSGGSNPVYMKSIDGKGGTLAYTSITYNLRTKKIQEFEIVFDSDDKWSTYGSQSCPGDGGEDGYFDLENVMTHEVGHALGLGHPKKTEFLTMYGYADYAETLKRTLGHGDELGIQELYG